MSRHRYLIAWGVGVALIAAYFVGVALWQMHVGILP
jgi:hypothetical protein